MSFHNSRQEHNTFRQGVRWLEQVRSQRIIPYFRHHHQRNEWLYAHLSRWAALLRDTARNASYTIYETLSWWTYALYEWMRYTGDALHERLPYWERTLRNGAQHAFRVLREIRLRWEHTLEDVTPHVDYVLRQALPSWMDRGARHTAQARREMSRLWADARQHAASYAQRMYHEVLPRWMDTLRDVLRHARQTLNEALPRWERALRDGARYAAQAMRVLAVASITFMDRHVPFRLRERDWRLAVTNAARGIPRSLAIVVIGIAAVAFALNMASHSSVLASLRPPQPATVDPNVTGPVAVHRDAAPAGTPTPPACQVGMWTPTPNPPASGTIKIYVRVSQNMQPVYHAAVYLNAQGGSSVSQSKPWYTDSYGLTSFTISYTGLSSTSPIQLSASTTLGDQTCSAQITLIR